MSEEIKDRIKSFLLGILFPLLLLCLAVPYITGERLTTGKGTVLTPVQAVGFGLFYLGWCLGIHGVFYHRYENHPAIKYSIVVAGVISFLAGLYLQFG